jgi:hypothetical protein
LLQQRHYRIALGMLIGNGIDFVEFIRGSLTQQWRFGRTGRHAGVDDPGPENFKLVVASV